MRSSGAKFDQTGFDQVIRDVEELNLNLSDLGQEAEGQSQSLTTINSSLNGFQTNLNALSSQVAALARQSSTATSNAAFAAYDLATGGTLAATPYPTSLTGWTLRTTIPAGTLTGFNTSTGVFVPPATGVYAFSLTFTGTTAASGDQMGVGFNGTWTGAHTNSNGRATVFGGDAVSVSETCYLNTTDSVSFNYSNSGNVTTWAFAMSITRIV